MDLEAIVTKVVPMLIGAAISLGGAIFAMGRKLGKFEEDRKAEATRRQLEAQSNSGEHRAIEHRLSETVRDVKAAHRRLDDHDRSLAIIGEWRSTHAKTVDDLTQRMEKLGLRIDELLMWLKNGRN